MKLIKKSEWFQLDTPLGEPNEKQESKLKYEIERVSLENDTIIWFGIKHNWAKENNKWIEYSLNDFVNPWKECEIPIYEKMYNELNRSTDIMNYLNTCKCGGHIRYTSINNSHCTSCGKTWNNI
jgi:hypothetical protein